MTGPAQNATIQPAQDAPTDRRLAALVARAPWVLRVTDRKGKQPPVLVIKQRLLVPAPAGRNGRARKAEPALPGLEAPGPTK